MLRQDEGEAAVAFWVLKNGRISGKYEVLMGAYDESVTALAAGARGVARAAASKPPR